MLCGTLISEGDPFSLAIDLGEDSPITRSASEEVPIGPFTVCVNDVAGNVVELYNGSMIVNGSFGLGFQGLAVTTVLISSAEKQYELIHGCTVMADLVLFQPTRGLHSLSFYTLDLPVAVVQISILSGPPEKLTYIGPENYNNAQVSTLGSIPSNFLVRL